jgi:hypothetical protein
MTQKPRLLSFEHDEDVEGWCSFCGSPSPRGVRVKKAEVTGGIPQTEPSFDFKEDDVRLAALREGFYYRIGACCVGRMVLALEKKKKS